ncbi:MAG: molybdenum cofactor guanylyltransferase [Chloroflexota bacterium]
MKVTAIILAGGKNLRLGRTKAIETIGGKSIIERVIERVRPLASQILIVTSTDRVKQLASQVLLVTGVKRTDLLLRLKDDAEFLTDLYPGYGPLGGIYTGLVASRTSHSIAVACDMPFLNTKLLGYMVEQAGDFDAVVPRLDGGMIEPLHAIYSRNCLEPIRERLESKQLSVEKFIKALRVRYIEQAESQRIDPKLLSFFNINYQADLERAIAIEAEENG